MEWSDYTRFVFALAFVIGLIWLAAYILKRTGMDKRLRGITGQQGRLAMVDVLYLDRMRKLTLVRADNREYLLLIAGDRVEVIDRMEVKHEASV